MTCPTCGSDDRDFRRCDGYRDDEPGHVHLYCHDCSDPWHDPAPPEQRGEGAARVRPERIAQPCPACGGQHLFIGDGGHITCSWIGCPDPTLATRVLAPSEPTGVGEREERVAEVIDKLRERADACDSDDYPERRSSDERHHFYAQGESDAYRDAADLLARAVHPSARAASIRAASLSPDEVARISGWSPSPDEQGREERLESALHDLTMPTDDQERYGVETWQELAERLVRLVARADEQRKAFRAALVEIRLATTYDNCCGQLRKIEKIADAVLNALPDDPAPSVDPEDVEKARLLTQLAWQEPEIIEAREALTRVLAALSSNASQEGDRG